MSKTLKSIEPVPSSTGNETPATPQATTVEELLQKIRSLEQEKSDAQSLAAKYREQLEHPRPRVGVPVESTTTTKPTLRFSVSGPPGDETFDVVDESEAKRMYCVRHKLEPSLYVLKVTCLDVEARNTRIVEQYEKAGVPTDRIPGVHLGV